MAFPVENRFIEQAERSLGVRLPNSYKGRVRRDNGGEMEATDDVWQLHPVFDTSERKRITRTGNHIVRETIENRKWDRFPKNGVAFASNGSGDVLIFLPLETEPQQLGETVHFWDHETGKTEEIAEDLADL